MDIDQLKSPLSVSCAQLSQAGRKKVNEDCIGIRIPGGEILNHKGIVSVIADGLSSAEAGREASEVSVQNLLYDYFCTPDTWTVSKSVHTVLKALNSWLYSQGHNFSSAEKGYLTTLSILILKNDTAHIFHIGDSRIYRIRDGKIHQITNDHSRVSDGRSYLTRAMGLDRNIEIDYQQESLKNGDCFILTTDGIHDFYPAKHWPKIINKSDNLLEACKALHRHALNSESDDNISCQIVKVDQIGKTSEERFFQNFSSLKFPPLLTHGNIIDGLKVIGTLYESSRSQLYIVEDINTSEQFVMKTPSPNFNDDSAYIERFIMESWLGRRFRSNKLVKVIQREAQATHLYYLMEHIEGVSLDEWMRKNAPCSPEKAVRIVRQIGLGLRYLHKQQVIHQDLKPSNILIDKNEQIKLIDYGSCYFQSGKELALPFNSNNNESNPDEKQTPLGTASYSAPECHLRKRIDSRSDQFSLALILYELLTGGQAFKGKLETLKNTSDLKALKYQPAHKQNSYIPLWIDPCIQKALSIEPKNRYGDIDEFIYELENTHKRSTLEERLPLIAQDPLKFWKGLALFQILAITTLIIYIAY